MSEDLKLLDEVIKDIKKKLYQKEYYQKNKERENVKNRKNHHKNKNKYNAHKREYAANNAETIKLRKQKYYIKNKDIINKRNSKWGKLNRKNRRDYEKNKMLTDINYRIQKLLRDRISKAIKRGCKRGSAVRDLGCSIEEFKKYIESKFQVGMNWKNHGQYGWHLDHIKPLSAFDLTDRKQLLEAVHYTNIQPLWAWDNLSKGTRYIKE